MRNESVSVSPADEAARRELCEKAARALAGLDEKFRLPVQLHCQEGLTQAEVAAVLEMRPGTVGVYVQRGLERLREILAREGVTAAPAVLLGGLSATALPAAPAGLAAAVEKLIASGAAGAKALAGTGAAAAGTLALGWKLLAGLATAVLLGAGTFGALRLARPPALPAAAPAGPAVPAGESAAEGIWKYGCTNGAEKVFRDRPDRPFQESLGGTLKVELAANEYEGAQLVLRSAKPLKGVRVTVSDLVAEGGRKIPSAQIEVLPVGYVNTKKPPYPVDYVGWWPDPLLNFLPAFDLDAEVWQPVWLDVHTAPDQPAGTYTGAVTVTAEGAPQLKAPIEVTVWNFAVPREYHFPLAVSMWDDLCHDYRRQPGRAEVAYSYYGKTPEEWKKFVAYGRGASLESVGSGEAKRLVEIRRKCHDLVLAHRLIPNCLYRDYPPRLDDVKRWRAAGARWFNIIYVFGRSVGKDGSYPPDEKKRILDALEEYIPKLKAEGLLDMAYIYGFDECGPDLFPAIKDIFGEIKKRWPTIPLMTTSAYKPDAGLDECVDVWVPMTPAFGDAKTSANIAAARERGKQVWWYVCVKPPPPYANWFIEQPAAAHRLLMGFMPHKFNSQGFLHYSMNLFCAPGEVKRPDGTTKHDFFAPFAEPLKGGPLTNSDGRSYGNYNGDGLIFYPGPDGPVPTIRMKCIRDGLEDYEYLWLLKEAVKDVKAGKRQTPAGWAERAEKALAVDPALVNTLKKYSTNGADLLAARLAIAKLLEELPAGSKPE